MGAFSGPWQTFTCRWARIIQDPPWMPHGRFVDHRTKRIPNKPISGRTRIENQFCLLYRAISSRNLEGEGEICPLTPTLLLDQFVVGLCPINTSEPIAHLIVHFGPRGPVNVRLKFSHELIGTRSKHHRFDYPNSFTRPGPNCTKRARSLVSG